MALLCTICVGEFVDLSVASIFGLVAVATTVLTVEHGWNVWLASVATVALGASCGAVNGLLVVRLGVNVICAVDVIFPTPVTFRPISARGMSFSGHGLVSDAVQADRPSERC